MGEDVKWTKGSAVRAVDGRMIYTFTASRGAWSMDIYAHELDEAKQKLKDETS